MIYSNFNQNKYAQKQWEDWGKLWCLKVAPRVEHFCWLLFHNAVKTHEYLYRMNLGPQTFCIFRNLDVETADHLFHTCVKSQEIWNWTSSAIRKTINLLNGISSGFWLNQDISSNDLFT